MDDQIATVALFAGYGIVYALVGWAQSAAKKDTPLQPRMFVKTIVVGIVAGLVASTQADQPSQEAVYSAMAIAVPVTDSILNTLTPPKAGGKEARSFDN